MINQLIDWYKIRHPKVAESIDNQPANPESEKALLELIEKILNPIEESFGRVTVTYGFTSLALKNYIQKHSPKQTASELDQHAACELNTKGKAICSRLGAACDIKVQGYENSMDVIAKFIIEHLPFDRIYFYSKQNSLHVSIGPENNQMVQMMKFSDKDHFVPTKRAIGKDALYLFDK